MSLIGFNVLDIVVVAYAIMWVIEAVTDLRLAGLDFEEQGTSAYPEYVLNGNDGTPKTLEESKVLVRSKASAVGD